MTKQTKKPVVKELNETPKVEKAPVLQLPEADANAFLQILGLILVGDDRLKPIQQHYVDMLKRNNEGLNEQPSK